ncbi:MAG: sulfotransferase [Thermodesulfobacteriota bacterium]|nr:sulfotransferase [Thermodesulfobacteriota bacterium]
MPDPYHFIVHTLRSGSTLLRCLLDEHRLLCSPPEIKWFCTDQRVRKAALKPILKRFLIKYNKIEHPRELYDAILKKTRKTILIDKSPDNLFHIRHIDTLFPHSKFIWIMRHPRDVHHSLLKLNWYEGIGLSDDYIKNAMRACERGLSGIGDNRKTIVKYEHLTSSPAETLTRLCRFLGVDFEPSMLRYDPDKLWGKGDFGYRIKTGRVLEAETSDMATPENLKGVAEKYYSEE